MLKKIDFKKDLFDLEFDNIYEQTLFDLLLEEFVENDNTDDTIQKLNYFFTYIEQFRFFKSVERYFRERSELHKQKFESSTLGNLAVLNSDLAESTLAIVTSGLNRIGDLIRNILRKLSEYLGPVVSYDFTDDIRLYKTCKGDILAYLEILKNDRFGFWERIGTDIIYRLDREFEIDLFEQSKQELSFSLWDIKKERVNYTTNKYTFTKYIII